MREVAERAGVAMSSVSRVLSEHPDVSEGMRLAVMTAVDELGYRPDLLAQGLRRQRTMSVGFTVSDISNPVLASAVTGAERRLREAGYSLLLTNSEGDPELDAKNIGLLEQRRVDGLILSLAEEHHVATAAALGAVEIPVVLLDRDPTPGLVASRVSFDHRSGMAAATRHLVELGHREVALITGGPRRPARERRLGVEETLAGAANGRCSLFEGEFSIEHGYRAALAILDERRATAVIAGGNVLMQGALRAFHERGVTVGADISFIGCDDVAVAELHSPQIAVVGRDMEALGMSGAELLLDQLAGASEPGEVTLPTAFVARPSCAPPAA
ncbi:MAG: LacI family transcriptional regulator, partial [Actinomycetota bacterium]|nr:LacI family transcriptional regulator [Actinomycetota bacterium]